ncbi:MAG: lipid-A-disaccharide synthase [Pseudohongiella sp.]|nr:lipid-A-disaccharide synthase [Pseudohongiella sp.]MDP2126195.1 lipid-A-disaccharide synthase [Pseudohongiella sp.]
MLIGIVAGEASGDILGAGLIRALRERFPTARFQGVGGPRMLECGFHSITAMERLSVMGFVEPLGRLPELLRLKSDLVKLFSTEKPAVFIGIDSPGFNLRLEQSLHDAGITTVHYVSPSVWAWGEKRIHKIAKAVDLMLALFPFESAIYQQHNIPVHCVGHPMADRIDPDEDQQQVREQARQQLALPAAHEIVCLMPGSRRDEVARLAPVFLKAAIACLQQRPGLHFVIPCANASRLAQVQGLLSQFLQQHGDGKALGAAFTVLDGQSHESMRAADIVLLASGTATLEAMLLKRPMIVAYKLSAPTWWLASRLVKVPYISLPNLLAGEELVPEFLQHAVTQDALSQELLRWLDDSMRQAALHKTFTRIHRSIRLDANAEAANAIAGLINRQRPAAETSLP